MALLPVGSRAPGPGLAPLRGLTVPAVEPLSLEVGPPPLRSAALSAPPSPRSAPLPPDPLPRPSRTRPPLPSASGPSRPPPAGSRPSRPGSRPFPASRPAPSSLLGRPPQCTPAMFSGFGPLLLLNHPDLRPLAPKEERAECANSVCRWALSSSTTWGTVATPLTPVLRPTPPKSHRAFRPSVRPTLESRRRQMSITREGGVSKRTCR